MASPLAATGWSVVYDCGIPWSCSLVSLDEAHILIINSPVFMWLFLLLPQLLCSVIVAILTAHKTTMMTKNKDLVPSNSQMLYLSR